MTSEGAGPHDGNRGWPIVGTARVLLAAASLVVGYGVFSPPRSGPSLMPWDKAEHFTAFFGLMLLAVVAFPRARLWVLGAWLSAAGVAIELIQALPIVHRDADWRDWAADTLGVLAIVGVLIAGRLRRAAA